MKILPTEFDQFIVVVDVILGIEPKAIAIVGSHGNDNKTPDGLSDFDLIFVFEVPSILEVIHKVQRALNEVHNLITLCLGVHPQFGHLISVSFPNEPLRWLDVGIMDVRFADDYLTGLPLRVLKGSVATTHVPPSPSDQMHQLAKKMLKARRRKDQQRMLSYAYRYLEWSNCKVDDPSDVIRICQYVFRDIQSRFPYLANREAL